MKKIKIKTLFCSTLAMLLCFNLYACTKGEKDEIPPKGDGIVVRPVYNKTKVFRNPLNGWVMYAARDADESYWDTRVYVPDTGETVNVIDYASACYLRTSWASLNPSDGVYAWNDPGSRIGNLIRGAERRGLPIAFRIVVDGRDQGMNTPQWVYDAGATYYLQNASYPTRRTPYPQDPVFQQYYTKFIEALAAEFDNPDRTAFIDAYGLGKWGEAHNVIYEPVGEAVTENTERLKEEVFDWVTDLYARCFTKVPLVINYHRLVGHPASWGSPNANSARLLGKAISKGYSLRHDAFGMNDYYQTWEKDFAKGWNYNRPIIMEGGWIVGSHGYWGDPAGYRRDHPEDVRLGEYNASKAGRVNMMDFRAGNETLTWFELTFSLVQKFISEGGYRLYPDELSMPSGFKSGAEVEITHRWRNMGWGYFPNNIPQWNFKYKVAFALLDSNGNVKKVFVNEDSEPSDWKDKAVTYKFTPTVDVPAGNYKWAVAIVDTKKDNKPAIKLAVSNEITDDGWLTLCNMEVK